MEQNFKKTMLKLKKERSRTNRRNRIVSSMACVVALCTVYLLILPAITLENKTYCGLTEHSHGAECYEQRIICGFDGENAETTETASEEGNAEMESVHVHTQDCYEDALICDCVVHTHNQECYVDSQAEPEEPEDSTSDPGAQEAPVVVDDPEQNTGESNQGNAQDVPLVSLSDEPPMFQLGESRVLEVGAGEVVDIPFTPSYTHEYIFYSTAMNPAGDPYGMLKNTNKDTIVVNDNYGSSKHFRVKSNLIEGNDYYLSTKWNDTQSSGEITVSLVLGSHTYNTLKDGIPTCTCGETFSEGSCGNGVSWRFYDGVLTIYGDGSMWDYGNGNNTSPWNPIYGMIEKVVIKDGVSNIGRYAFYSCNSLKSVTIPSSVISIGDSAFYDCSALTSVEIPSSVTSIGDSVFRRCSSLTSIEIPSSVISIGESIFYDCSALTSVKIPSGVTSIGNNAFYGCSSLTSIEIPSGVTSIGNYAFSSCSSLTLIEIPSGVTSIGDYTFYGCSSLTSIEIPSGVTSIGNNAFHSCSSLTSIEIPSGVTSIGNNAFYGCSSLTSIEIPSGVTSIGSNAFQKCSNLTEMVWNAANGSLSSSQLAIGSFHITVGPDVDVLSKNTVTALCKMGGTSVTFTGPNHLTMGGWTANWEEDALNNLPEGEYYVTGDGVIYRIYSTGEGESKTAALYFCPKDLTEYEVPAALPAPGEDEATIPVTEVVSNAFYHADKLERITFAAPGAITRLADYAFYHAQALTSINGMTTDVDILFSFPNAQAGIQIFDKTQISFKDAVTTDPMEMTKNNVTLSMVTKPEVKYGLAVSEGTYHYYTGQDAVTTVSISNQNGSLDPDGSIVRIVYKFDNGRSVLKYKVGTYQLTTTDGKSQYNMTVKASNVPFCYLIDIECPRQGDALSVDLGSQYPSPTSGGGTAYVWGAILDASEAQGGGLPEQVDGKYHKIRWITKRDPYGVTLSNNSSSPNMTGDGQGGAYIKQINYQIRLQKEGTALSVGRDELVGVDYTDTLILPAGAAFAPDVQECLENGTYLISYSSTSDPWNVTTPGGKTIFKLQDYYKNTSIKDISITQEGNLCVSWNCNRNLTSILRYSLGDEVVWIAEPEPNTSYQIQNTLSVAEHYTYSADATRDAQLINDVSTTEGSLELTKTRGSKYNYRRGETVTFALTASNPGVLPYNALAYLSDDLPNVFYMTADQIAQVFQEDPDHQLTLTILKARLCTPTAGKAVMGMDGSTVAHTILQNSGANTAYDGLSSTDPDLETDLCNIGFAWGENGNLRITVDGGAPMECPVEGSAIQQILDSLGYLITPDAQYTLLWQLTPDGEPIRLPGSGSITKQVSCTIKDTFMSLNQDTYRNNADRETSVPNDLRALDKTKTQLKQTGVYVYYRPDFRLEQSWLANGNVIEEETVIEQGDVLDYAIQVDHLSGASYDLLPVVERLAGGQALIVPMAPNRNNDWAQSCDTVTLEDGTEVYLLLKEGTYSHVWTSETQMADTVTVKKTSDGLDTVMHWYFTQYGGTRVDTISFRGYVCPADVLPSDTMRYLLKGEVWLNDHESHRWYCSPGPWQGNTFRFNKRIVTNLQDTGDGTDYSIIQEGETVIYRLMLQSLKDSEGEFTELLINGAQMKDLLPLSVESWLWDKSKVKVHYMAESDSYDVINGDSWEILQEGSETGTGQQVIQWNSDFYLRFKGEAYIYVTLEYPSGEPWKDYARQFGATELVNTFSVMTIPSSVKHNLYVPATVRLQQGVVASRETHSHFYREFPGCNYPEERLYFSNEAPYQHAVYYYVGLYNGGDTNLYLTDMQVRLPRGFRIIENKSFYSNTNDYTDRSPAIFSDLSGESIKTLSVNIEPSNHIVGDVQYVNFHFTKSERDNTVPASYDERSGTCYLKPGESIAFYYGCSTEKEADTDDFATCTLSMPFSKQRGGVEVDTDSQITVKNGDKFVPNDGGCAKETNIWAESYGFLGGAEDTQWLTSEVTVKRSVIKPGITKAFTSTTNTEGVVTNNPSLVLSTDIMTWTITTVNDGMKPIADYTITDVMQAPYMFNGKVNYTISRSYNENGLVPEYNDCLFEIQPGDTADTYVLTSRTFIGDSDIVKKTLTVDGDPVEMRAAMVESRTAIVKFDVAISRSGDNAVLSIRMKDMRLAIPEMGYSVLTLSTKNTTTALENKQYINAAYITPMVQNWDGSTNKGNLTSLQTPYAENPLPSVRNTAPVTTSYGYVTSSSMEIAEAEGSSNSASSTGETNFIVLPNIGSINGKTFRYTATVENSTEMAMNKLILIDNLPETGDHTSFLTDDPRFSEFKISLADDPNFVVTVTEENGTVTTLGADQYSIGFTDKTVFDTEDWGGTSDWSGTAASARSLRMVINDSGGTLIPARSKVSLHFTCKIDDPNVQPGQYAWNSFGYHCGHVGTPVELESAALKVGVKTPGRPLLKKNVVDHRGQANPVAQDTTFSFLIYPGEALPGTFATKDELIAALGETPYEEYSITVNAGESVSEALRLDPTKWIWQSGEKYTITEWGIPEKYAYKSFNGTTGASYTFTYDQTQMQSITCENIFLEWQISLIKVNTSDEVLSGAVFALYSPNSHDHNPNAADAYPDLQIASVIQQLNQNWYLVSVMTTGADGKLEWKGLLEDSYYLLEAKAPDGYNTDKAQGYLLYGSEAMGGVYEIKVVNRIGFQIPETGGTGTYLYSIGGMLLLIFGAFLLGYPRIKAGKKSI